MKLINMIINSEQILNTKIHHTKIIFKMKMQ